MARVTGLAESLNTQGTPDVEEMPGTGQGRARFATDMIESTRTYQHYEVLRRGDGSPWELGRGAMGITYKAIDVNLRCEVALKVVISTLLDHPEARDRFVREARAAAALRHRNVASVYHLGNDGEHFFYAMEFIDGETLDALVRRQGPMSPVSTLRIILQVTRALMAAARQALVHRDIKPTNLMVAHEDADDHMVIKVIDFGLARPVASEDAGAQLTVGGFLGTPQYASPEQLEEKPLDARSDIYSLGVTAWFLLTGRVPFAGSLATVCQQQLTKPPPWGQLPDAVPPPVRRLLAHMLAKEPHQRPQDAAELRREIEACLQAMRPAEEDDESWSDENRREGSRATASSGVMPTPPSVGTVLGGRYELIQLVAENQGNRVYHARDLRTSRRPVMLRTFATETTDTPEKRARLENDFRAIQSAAQPGLVRLCALEQPAAPQPVFLVEEWIDGFSLRDFLAAQGGTLPVEDVLRLLEYTAPTADQAAALNLSHLGLDLHQVYVHFPSTQLGLAGASTARALLPVAMAQWPSDWIVKIHPYILLRDAVELDTWSGDVTLLPGSRAPQSDGLPLTVQHRRSLAGLVFEMLGGDPTRIGKFGFGQETQSLPALNEIANRVLRQAMSEADVLGTSQEFYHDLTVAIGSETVGFVRPVIEARPSEVSVKPGPTTLEPLSPAPMHGGFTERRREPTNFSAPASVRPATSFTTRHEPMRPDAHPSVDGGAWERMNLVTGEPSHAGRWFVVLTTVAVVFVAAFVGVLVALLYYHPGSDSRTQSSQKPGRMGISTGRAAVTKSTDHLHALPTARAADSPPLSATSPSPVPTPIWGDRVPLPLRAADRHLDDPAPTIPAPLAGATVPNSPAAMTSPSPARGVAVRITSIPRRAEISLRGKFLGVTPLEVTLPPGDHQLIARFQDYPETRENLHLTSNEPRASVEIHMMLPGLVPTRQDSAAAQFIRARRATPSPEPRNVRPAFAKPPAPMATIVPTTPTPTPSPTEPEVRRALPIEETARPILTPFITPGPKDDSQDRPATDDQGADSKPKPTPEERGG